MLTANGEENELNISKLSTQSTIEMGKSELDSCSNNTFLGNQYILLIHITNLPLNFLSLFPKLLLSSST